MVSKVTQNQLCRRACGDDGLTADADRKSGVTPTVLIVPPALESAALHLLNTELEQGGSSNLRAGMAQLIGTPYL